MTQRICSDSSEVKEIPTQNFKNRKTPVSMHIETHTHTHTRVKHCWRLMEAVIGVEVSTDTPDPKIMRQQDERGL